MASILPVLLTILSGLTVCQAIGTTRNIQEIFEGRCWEFQRLIKPELFQTGEKNCTELWVKFRDAFIFKNPCNVSSEDYRPFTEAAAHPTGSNVHLFWENVYPFVNEYSARGQRYTTVSDTLLGYMANMMMWCGIEGDPGFNYDDCPVYTDCPSGIAAEYAYWIMVSQMYADLAVGTAHVLMNGSVSVPFDPNSIFATYELVNLTPEKNVTRLEIFVLHELGGPVIESCGEGSLMDLEVRAQGQGLQTSCTNNPASIRYFQCVDNPGAAECMDLNPNPSSDLACDIRGSYVMTLFIYLGFLIAKI